MYWYIYRKWYINSDNYFKTNGLSCDNTAVSTLYSNGSHTLSLTVPANISKGVLFVVSRPAPSVSASGGTLIQKKSGSNGCTYYIYEVTDMNAGNVIYASISDLKDGTVETASMFLIW